MVQGIRRWRRLAALAGLLAALCALGAIRVRAEAVDALAIDFTAQPGVMVAPGDVTMTFVIENRSGQPVQNIYLSSADGTLSEPLGQLGPGESQTLVRPHAVTQEELDAGEIAYDISHDPLVEGGEKVVYTVRAEIVKGEQQPRVSFTRQLSSEYVAEGGVVTVTYKIANTGNVTLSSLRIRDTLGDFTGRLEQLEVGDTKTFISRVTLSEPATSQPELEFAVPSGKELRAALDPAPIRIADTRLDMRFSVARGVFNKDTADAALILTNQGNVDYTGVTVLDDVYGGVIADAVSLPAGGEPVVISRTYPLRGKGEFRWRVTGMNGAGEALDRRTDTLTVPEAGGDATVSVTLQAAARTPRINRPGRVTFDFTITNSGTAMGRDARLYEVNRGDIRRLAVLPAGESMPTAFSASYDVGGDAQFIFCLTYTDAQGRQQTVSTSGIDVVIAPDGETPEPADSAGRGLRGGSVKPGGSSSTFIVLLIIAGTALTAMLTILAVTSVRARRERLRRVAAEKQRVKAELGRTGSFPAVKAPKKKTSK